MDIGSTPQFDAPVLAELCRRMIERPYWAKTDPLAVD